MTETLIPVAFAPAAVSPTILTPWPEPAGVATDLAPVEEELWCTGVLDITPDVKSFVLRRDSSDPLVFLPGQYLSVTVDVDGQTLSRCYSIDSSLTRPEQLSITVKRVAGGPVSTYLHDRFGVGDRLRATGPYGQFTFGDRPQGKYLFLTAGSGITPAMSMTRTLADGAAPADVVLVHNARTPQDVIFHRELDQIALLPGFSIVLICEQGSTVGPSLAGTGLLTLRTLLRAAPDLHEREVFTCGPPAYMQAARKLLALAAVDPVRCHEENFDLTDRADGAADERARTPGVQRYAVEFRRRGKAVDCDADEPILTAARRAGLNPPAMCAQGMCGTCLTRLVDGHVDMQQAGGISRRQVEDGNILICCSRPTTDVVLDA